MHNEFRTEFVLKNLDLHYVLCKESTSIYRERGKGERSPWRTKRQEEKGHLEMWRHLLELSRCLSQSTSSGTSRTTVFNLLEENSLLSETVER